MVEGVPGRTTVVNVLDVCNDSDCTGSDPNCCSKNTANGKWKMIDLEVGPASKLYGFDANTVDIGSYNWRQATGTKGVRDGAPNSSPLCYRDRGPADIVP